MSQTTSKGTKTLGIISVAIIITASIFKFTSIPGGGILFLLGFMLFMCTFLPKYFIGKIKNASNAISQVAVAMGLMVFELMSVAVVFQVQHWPGAENFVPISLGMALLVYLPFLVIGKRKEGLVLKDYKLDILFLVAMCLFTFFMKVKEPNFEPFINQINNSKIQVDSLITAHDELVQEIELGVQNNPENQKYLNAASVIRRNTTAVTNSIDELFANLIAATEGLPISDVEDLVNDVRLIGPKDNYDIPTYYFLGENYQPPFDGRYAYRLKMALLNYSTLVVAEVKNPSLEISEDNISQVKTYAISTNDKPQSVEGKDKYWETEMFYHQPLIIVLARLMKLEVDVVMLEAIALDKLSEKMGEGEE